MLAQISHPFIFAYGMYMYTTDEETITSNFLISHKVKLTEKLPN